MVRFLCLVCHAAKVLIFNSYRLFHSRNILCYFMRASVGLHLSVRTDLTIRFQHLIEVVNNPGNVLLAWLYVK